MKQVLMLAVAMAFWGCSTAKPPVRETDLLADAAGQSSPADTKSRPADGKNEETETGHSLGHKVLLYIPNRLLDALDIFRARVRVGPGIAVGARATKVAQGFIGTYFTAYAGLPGPRMRRLPKLPVGLESHTGIDVSVVEASAGAFVGPGYSPSEFGAGIQALFVGFDLGFDPVELLDFVAGLLFFDLRDDDL